MQGQEVRWKGWPSTIPRSSFLCRNTGVNRRNDIDHRILCPISKTLPEVCVFFYTRSVGGVGSRLYRLLVIHADSASIPGLAFARTIYTLQQYLSRVQMANDAPD